MSIDSQAEKRAPGRPTVGDRAMTASERKHRSRQKLALTGEVEVAVRVSQQTIRNVDSFAAVSGESRIRVLQTLVDVGLQRMNAVFQRAEEMRVAGKSDAEIADYVRSMLVAPQSFSKGGADPT